MNTSGIMPEGSARANRQIAPYRTRYARGYHAAHISVQRLCPEIVVRTADSMRSALMNEDRIYSMPLQHVGNFEFDERVVDVFPDMISRSVPGYASILAMTAELAERYALPDTSVYDLGCSLGAATLLIRSRIPASCQIEAVDSSPAMVSRMRDLVQADESLCRVNIREKDVRDVRVTNASFAVLNFTLQFIPPEGRTDILQNILDGLEPGGALVLSEKVHFDDPQQQELMTELHHAFKRAHGYSELEIAQKRTALEDTLVTETLASHLARLQQVGFVTASPWFQCFNFISILAVK